MHAELAITVIEMMAASAVHDGERIWCCAELFDEVCDSVCGRVTFIHDVVTAGHLLCTCERMVKYKNECGISQVFFWTRSLRGCRNLDSEL